MTLFTGLLLITALISAVVYFYGRENTLAAMFGPADQGRTVFKNFKRSTLPNNALICPENFCDNATPDSVAPVFSFSVGKLRDLFQNSIKNEKRLERVHTNDPAMRERYVQRSQMFSFPDTIQVEFIALTPNTSTIALYSNAQLGFSDGKVNFKRLKRWLKRLEEHVV